MKLPPLLGGLFTLAMSGALAVTLASPDPAAAGFPGLNGKIAYASSDAVSPSIWVMRADGSGPTNLTRLVDEDFGADWQTVPSADLAVGMVAVAKANRPLTYTISVRNAGPSNATRAVVTDQLPVNGQFVSASSSQGSCQTPAAGATGTVTCDLGFLPRDPGAGAPRSRQP